jgi:hypothetical protein
MTCNITSTPLAFATPFTIGYANFMTDTTRGYLLALAGVVIFGLTLPFTRIAVAELPPVFVGWDVLSLPLSSPPSCLP